METVQIVNFWSKRKREDVSLPAELVWLNSRVGEVWMAEYEGERLIRLRDEHAMLDPYFRLSSLVKQQLREFRKDVTQQQDSDFDTLYPQHKKEREQKLADNEYQSWMNSSSMNSK